MTIVRLDRPQPKLLARQLSQQTQTITGVVDRLEAAGLLVRIRDLGDRRAVRLELTAEGIKVAEAVEIDVEKHAAELFRSYGARKVRALRTHLEDVRGQVRFGVRERVMR